MSAAARLTWAQRSPGAALFILGMAVALAFLLKMGLGTVSIPLRSNLGALVGEDGRVAESIVLGFRLPRALTAMVAGAALAVSGLQMQTLLNNPLAGPWILGVVSSARLGVAVLLLGGGLLGAGLATTLGPLASLALAIAAVAGAAAGMVAVMWLARRVGIVTLLITGVIGSYVADSAATLLITLAPDSQKALFTAWNDGNFEKVSWPQLRVCLALVLLALPILVGLVKLLDALVLGEPYARSVGHHTARGRHLAVTGIVLLTGTITAFCGPLAFIDVAVPHLARQFFRTASHRVLLPATALLGMIVALVGDLVTSLPGGQRILHVNSVTAVLCGPLVLWMLLRRNGRRIGTL